MLNEAKVREKIQEMKVLRTSRISWTEKGVPYGWANDVTSEMRTADTDFMLEEVSAKFVKLYMKIDGIYESVMLFEKGGDKE